MSETRIGSYLAKQGSQAKDLFTIATKAGITADAEGKRSYDNSLKHIEMELDKSLERLGVDQVELLYIHRRDAKTEIEEVASSLATLVKSGKIRQIGFQKSPTSLERVHRYTQWPLFNLSIRSLLDHQKWGWCKRQRARNNLIAFSPVGRSLLTDNPLEFEACRELAL